jgi:hypothetical protein
MDEVSLGIEPLRECPHNVSHARAFRLCAAEDVEYVFSHRSFN